MSILSAECGQGDRLIHPDREIKKKTQPPAEELKKIADALDTTVDYLINGDTLEKAKSALKDTELLQQFKAVEQMNEDDRTVIKRLIDAFITKGKIKQLAL